MSVSAQNIVNIYKIIHFVEDGCWVNLTISDERLLHDVRCVLKDQHLSGISTDNNDELYVGQTIELFVDRPKKSVLPVFENFNGLISSYPIKTPVSYYLKEEQFFNQTDKDLPLYHQYDLVVNFCNFLI